MCLFFIGILFFVDVLTSKCNIDSGKCIVGCQYGGFQYVGCSGALTTNQNNACFHLVFNNGIIPYCQPVSWRVSFVVCRFHGCTSLYTIACNDPCHQQDVVRSNDLKNGAINTCLNEWTLYQCINLGTCKTNDFHARAKVHVEEGHVLDHCCHGIIFIESKT